MLKIDQLSHVYPNGTRALDSVSLEVGPGMFGLLGPNGAGKSTLMRCVATLQTPTSGSIRFGEIDVLRDPDALRRTLGYLPQDFGVYPRVSAYEMLDHIAVLKGYSARGERRTVVETLLNQVNLWDVRHKSLAGFSGGMRQRFGVAQSLIGRPQLVIVDEPTAGLDPEESQSIPEPAVRDRREHGRDPVDAHRAGRREPVPPDGDHGRRPSGVRRARRSELIAELQGTHLAEDHHKGELDAHRAAHEVIATLLQAGRTVIHVLADANPGAGFSPAEGSLEDVYFSTLSSVRRAA